MIGRFAFALVLLLLGAGVSWAQQQTLRVSGVVDSFDGRVLAIRSDKLGEVKVSLVANATVFGVAEAKLADVKPGSYIGVGAMPQPDGSQRAIQVTILANLSVGWVRAIGRGTRGRTAR